MLSYNVLVKQGECMSSLSDFAKNYKPKEKEEKAQNINVEEIRKNFSQSENIAIDENIKKTFEKYEHMDQNQLYQQLFQEASKLKSSGQFNYESLHNSIQNMGAYLNPEQKQNMLNLLEKLK